MKGYLQGMEFNMTVFLDSNIILDVLLKNKDFCDESKQIFKSARITLLQEMQKILPTHLLKS